MLFSSLTGDILLNALTGALFAIISYSSLAAVLLTGDPLRYRCHLLVVLCLAIGANLGSLLFKLIGCLVVLPFFSPLADSELVIYFHVFYNLFRCLTMVPFADHMAGCAVSGLPIRR